MKSWIVYGLVGVGVASVLIFLSVRHEAPSIPEPSQEEIRAARLGIIPIYGDLSLVRSQSRVVLGRAAPSSPDKDYVAVDYKATYLASVKRIAFDRKDHVVWAEGGMPNQDPFTGNPGPVLCVISNSEVKYLTGDAMDEAIRNLKKIPLDFVNVDTFIADLQAHKIR